MAAIKSYSDLQQSKKLATILPLESADMYYPWYIEDDGDTIESGHRITTPRIGNFTTHKINKMILPCWSLAVLLEQLPYELCDDDGNSSYLQMNKEDDVYQLVYTDPHVDFESIETDRYEHFVDACVAMIEKLHELNLL